MNHREHLLLKQTGSSTKPDFAANYHVHVYPVGALVSSGATHATQQVEAGHGFRVNDKTLIVNDSTATYSGAFKVQSTTATSVMFSGALTTQAGDKLVNLGPDPGVEMPNYDASPMVIYSDADGGARITHARVMTSARGEYSYWHRGDGKFWELVRSPSGRIADVIVGSGISRRLNTVDFGDLGDGSVTASVAAALQAIQPGEDMLHYGMTTPFVACADGDATPSVKGRRFFRTSNTAPTTISALDDGIVGQQITLLIGDDNTTVDFTGTNLFGNLGADWTPAAGDAMRCTHDGTSWFCKVSDNTA